MPYRDPTPVRILIYASRSNLIGPVFGQMESIRAVVARRNIALGLGTALLHQSGWFVQWVEGPAEAVQQVIDRVAADPRHGAMHVVHDAVAPRQLHDSWSMAVVQADELPDDFGRRVAALLHDRERGLHHAPAAVWRLLSTPLGHAGAQAHDDPNLFCRTLVCAADFDESFDLVRWLGGRHRVDVVRRRFAGVDTPDVATDYVDFADAGLVHRVIAMARNGIRIGLTRAFLADYGCIVLVRGGDAKRDAQLLEMLCAACDGLLHRPVLLGVGADAASHEPLRRMARGRAMHYLNVDVDDRRDSAQLWRAIAPVVREFAAPVPMRATACAR
jgi:hypothetical protein